MNSSFNFSTIGKYKKLRPELSAVRFAIIDRVIATGCPVPMNSAIDICASTGFVDELIAGNYLGLDENGEIGYLYPVSAYPTGHRVRLSDGREFDTMCAIDSLGCATTFGMDAEIFSFCKDTEASVKIEVRNGIMEKVLPEGMYVSYYDSWTDGSFNF